MRKPKLKECKVCHEQKYPIDFARYNERVIKNICICCDNKQKEYNEYLKLNNLKVCPKCLKEKHLEEFACANHQIKRYKDGRYSHCAECERIFFKEYRKKYAERYNEQRIKYRQKNGTILRKKAREYLQTHKFKNLATRTNTFSRIKSTGEEITAIQLWGLAKKQKLRCAISGIKLTNKNLSVDHIIPYANGGKNVIENLQLVDLWINQMKNCHSTKDLLNMIKVIYEFNRLSETGAI